MLLLCLTGLLMLKRMFGGWLALLRPFRWRGASAAGTSNWARIAVVGLIPLLGDRPPHVAGRL